MNGLNDNTLRTQINDFILLNLIYTAMYIPKPNILLSCLSHLIALSV